MSDATPARPEPQAINFTQELSVQQWSFESPLPPPSVLAEYEALIPGFAERFLAQWEQQTQHRQRLEALVVGTEARTQERGQHYTLALGVVALVVAGVLGVTGHDGAAVAVMGIDFATLGGVFFLARRHDEQERRRKSAAVPEVTATAAE